MLGAAFSHGVSGGSGVLAGSINDNVTGTISRPLSRTFSGGLNFGFSRNDGLAVASALTPTTTTTSGEQGYDYWFGGGSLTHPFNRRMDLFVNYQLQYQTSGATFCVGATCQTSAIRHTISVGLNWRGRPVTF